MDYRKRGTCVRVEMVCLGCVGRRSTWSLPQASLHGKPRAGTLASFENDLAVGRTILGVGAPPILVDFSGDWDVH